MEGKMFFYQKGNVFVRTSDNLEVSFNSLESFNKYYSGTIDLSGEYYIDYEPDKQVFYCRKDPTDYSPMANQYSGPIEPYETIIADTQNMLTKLENPYFGMSLEEAREYKLNAIKMNTYRTIIAYMPEWRQLRWNEYVKIHEKVLASQPLTTLEQTVYSNFPKEGETNESCYNDAKLALQWIIECIIANDVREKEVTAARYLKTVINVTPPDYPPFPI